MADNVGKIVPENPKEKSHPCPAREADGVLEGSRSKAESKVNDEIEGKREDQSHHKENRQEAVQVHELRKQSDSQKAKIEEKHEDKANWKRTDRKEPDDKVKHSEVESVKKTTRQNVQKIKDPLKKEDNDEKSQHLKKEADQKTATKIEKTTTTKTSGNCRSMSKVFLDAKQLLKSQKKETTGRKAEKMETDNKENRSLDGTESQQQAPRKKERHEYKFKSTKDKTEQSQKDIVPVEKEATDKPPTKTEERTEKPAETNRDSEHDAILKRKISLDDYFQRLKNRDTPHLKPETIEPKENRWKLTNDKTNENPINPQTQINKDPERTKQVSQSIIVDIKQAQYKPESSNIKDEKILKKTEKEKTERPQYAKIDENSSKNKDKTDTSKSSNKRTKQMANEDLLEEQKVNEANKLGKNKFRETLNVRKYEAYRDDADQGIQSLEATRNFDYQKIKKENIFKVDNANIKSLSNYNRDQPGDKLIGKTYGPYEDKGLVETKKTEGKNIFDDNEYREQFQEEHREDKEISPRNSKNKTDYQSKLFEMKNVNKTLLQKRAAEKATIYKPLNNKSHENASSFRTDKDSSKIPRSESKEKRKAKGTTFCEKSEKKEDYNTFKFFEKGKLDDIPHRKLAPQITTSEKEDKKSFLIEESQQYQKEDLFRAKEDRDKTQYTEKSGKTAKDEDNKSAYKTSSLKSSEITQEKNADGQKEKQIEKDSLRHKFELNRPLIPKDHKVEKYKSAEPHKKEDEKRGFLSVFQLEKNNKKEKKTKENEEKKSMIYEKNIYEKKNKSKKTMLVSANDVQGFQEKKLSKSNTLQKTTKQDKPDDKKAVPAESKHERHKLPHQKEKGNFSDAKSIVKENNADEKKEQEAEKQNYDRKQENVPGHEKHISSESQEKISLQKKPNDDKKSHCSENNIEKPKLAQQLDKSIICPNVAVDAGKKYANGKEHLSVKESEIYQKRSESKETRVKKESDKHTNIVSDSEELKISDKKHEKQLEMKTSEIKDIQKLYKNRPRPTVQIDKEKKETSDIRRSWHKKTKTKDEIDKMKVEKKVDQKKKETSEIRHSCHEKPNTNQREIDEINVEKKDSSEMMYLSLHDGPEAKEIEIESSRIEKKCEQEEKETSEIERLLHEKANTKEKEIDKTRVEKRIEQKEITNTTLKIFLNPKSNNSAIFPEKKLCASDPWQNTTEEIIADIKKLNPSENKDIKKNVSADKKLNFSGSQGEGILKFSLSQSKSNILQKTTEANEDQKLHPSEGKNVQQKLAQQQAEMALAKEDSKELQKNKHFLVQNDANKKETIGKDLLSEDKSKIKKKKEKKDKKEKKRKDENKDKHEKGTSEKTTKTLLSSEELVDPCSQKIYNEIVIKAVPSFERDCVPGVQEKKLYQSDSPKSTNQPTIADATIRNPSEKIDENQTFSQQKEKASVTKDPKELVKKKPCSTVQNDADKKEKEIQLKKDKKREKKEKKKSAKTKRIMQCSEQDVVATSQEVNLCKLDQPQKSIEVVISDAPENTTTSRVEVNAGGKDVNVKERLLEDKLNIEEGETDTEKKISNNTSKTVLGSNNDVLPDSLGKNLYKSEQPQKIDEQTKVVDKELNSLENNNGKQKGRSQQEEELDKNKQLMLINNDTDMKEMVDKTVKSGANIENEIERENEEKIKKKYDTKDMKKLKKKDKKEDRKEKKKDKKKGEKKKKKEHKTKNEKEKKHSEPNPSQNMGTDAEMLNTNEDITNTQELSRQWEATAVQHLNKSDESMAFMDFEEEEIADKGLLSDVESKKDEEKMPASKIFVGLGSRETVKNASIFEIPKELRDSTRSATQPHSPLTKEKLEFQISDGTNRFVPAPDFDITPISQQKIPKINISSLSEIDIQQKLQTETALRTKLASDLALSTKKDEEATTDETNVDLSTTTTIKRKIVSYAQWSPGQKTHLKCDDEPNLKAKQQEENTEQKIEADHKLKSVDIKTVKETIPEQHTPETTEPKKNYDHKEETDLTEKTAVANQENDCKENLESSKNNQSELDPTLKCYDKTKLKVIKEKEKSNDQEKTPKKQEQKIEAIKNEANENEASNNQISSKKDIKASTTGAKNEPTNKLNLKRKLNFDEYWEKQRQKLDATNQKTEKPEHETKKLKLEEKTIENQAQFQLVQIIKENSMTIENQKVTIAENENDCKVKKVKSAKQKKEKTVEENQKKKAKKEKKAREREKKKTKTLSVKDKTEKEKQKKKTKKEKKAIEKQKEKTKSSDKTLSDEDKNLAKKTAKKIKREKTKKDLKSPKAYSDKMEIEKDTFKDDDSKYNTENKSDNKLAETCETKKNLLDMDSTITGIAQKKNNEASQSSQRKAKELQTENNKCNVQIQQSNDQQVLIMKNDENDKVTNLEEYEKQAGVECKKNIPEIASAVNQIAKEVNKQIEEPMNTEEENNEQMSHRKQISFKRAHGEPSHLEEGVKRLKKNISDKKEADHKEQKTDRNGETEKSLKQHQPKQLSFIKQLKQKVENNVEDQKLNRTEKSAEQKKILEERQIENNIENLFSEKEAFKRKRVLDTKLKTDNKLNTECVECEKTKETGSQKLSVIQKLSIEIEKRIENNIESDYFEYQDIDWQDLLNKSLETDTNANTKQRTTKLNLNQKEKQRQPSNVEELDNEIENNQIQKNLENKNQDFQSFFEEYATQKNSEKRKSEQMEIIMDNMEDMLVDKRNKINSQPNKNVDNTPNTDNECDAMQKGISDSTNAEKKVTQKNVKGNQVTVQTLANLPQYNTSEDMKENYIDKLLSELKALTEGQVKTTIDLQANRADDSAEKREIEKNMRVEQSPKQNTKKSPNYDELARKLEENLEIWELARKTDQNLKKTEGPATIIQPNELHEIEKNIRKSPIYAKLATKLEKNLEIWESGGKTDQGPKLQQMEALANPQQKKTESVAKEERKQEEELPNNKQLEGKFENTMEKRSENDLKNNPEKTCTETKPKFIKQSAKRETGKNVEQKQKQQFSNLEKSKGKHEDEIPEKKQKMEILSARRRKVLKEFKRTQEKMIEKKENIMESTFSKREKINIVPDVKPLGVASNIPKKHINSNPQKTTVEVNEVGTKDKLPSDDELFKKPSTRVRIKPRVEMGHRQPHKNAHEIPKKNQQGKQKVENNKGIELERRPKKRCSDGQHRIESKRKSDEFSTPKDVTQKASIVSKKVRSQPEAGGTPEIDAKEENSLGKVLATRLSQLSAEGRKSAVPPVSQIGSRRRFLTVAATNTPHASKEGLASSLSAIPKYVNPRSQKAHARDMPDLTALEGPAVRNMPSRKLSLPTIKKLTKKTSKRTRSISSRGSSRATEASIQKDVPINQKTIEEGNPVRNIPLRGSMPVEMESVNRSTSPLSDSSVEETISYELVYPPSESWQSKISRTFKAFKSDLASKLSITHRALIAQRTQIRLLASRSSGYQEMIGDETVEAIARKNILALEQARNLEANRILQSFKEDLTKLAAERRRLSKTTVVDSLSEWQPYKLEDMNDIFHARVMRKGLLAGQAQKAPARRESAHIQPHLTDEDDMDLEEIGVPDTYKSYCSSKLSEKLVDMENELKHPNEVVESSTLYSMELPKVTYSPVLSDIVRDVSPLSALQVEAMIYACQAHEQMLPNGQRTGFLLGDGPGVGKGRTLASIIHENYKQGRKRAVWISVAEHLRFEVERNLSDIGANLHINVASIAKFKYNHIGLSDEDGETFKKGIICCTYTELISETADPTAKYRSHVSQLVHWLGKNGIIILDDCHKASSLCLTNADRFIKLSTVLLKLQQLLPLARVIYSSATGANEPRNMIYMTRLGLWGLGTPYTEFIEFVNAVEKRGRDAMDVVAIDMKLRGIYVSRHLSLHNVNFRIEEVQMSDDFRKFYNYTTDLWAKIKEQLGKAYCRLHIANCVQERINRQFWAAHQRFFKVMCLASKLTQVVKLVEEAKLNDRSVIIGVQSAGEYRSSEHLEQQQPNLTSFVSTVYTIVKTFIERYFPAPSAEYIEQLQQKGAFAPQMICPNPDESKRVCVNRESSEEEDDDFSDSSIDEDGMDTDPEIGLKLHRLMLPKAERTMHQHILKQIVNNMQAEQEEEEDFEYSFDSIDPQADQITESEMRRCICVREKFLSKIEQLSRRMPPNTLDQIIAELGGSSQVAELTNRRMRVLRQADGVFKYEQRGAAPAALDVLNYGEGQSFMAGVKRVAIISEPAASGISLHSDRGVANQKPRTYISLELPWNAERALQLFGCSKRTNQVNEPEFVMVISDAATELHQANMLATALKNLGATDLDAIEGDIIGRDRSLFHMNNSIGSSALEHVLMQLAGKKPLETMHLPEIYEGDFIADCCEAMTDMGLLQHANTDDAGNRVYDLVTSSGCINIPNFLNRLLGCRIELQTGLFRFFLNQMYAMMLEIKRTRLDDLGVIDLDVHGGTVTVTKLIRFRRRYATGTATTELHTIELESGMSFDTAVSVFKKKPRQAHEGFYILHHKRNSMNCAILCLNPHTEEEPTEEPNDPSKINLVVLRPNTGTQVRTEVLSSLLQRYVKASPKAAQPHWEMQYSKCLHCCSHIYWCCRCPYGKRCQLGVRVRTYHILSGLMVSIWERVAVIIEKNGRQMQMVRVKADNNRTIVGTVVPEFAYTRLITDLSCDATVETKNYSRVE